MRISDWSSDVCSSDLGRSASARRHRKRCVAGDGLAELRPPRLAPPETLDMRCARRRAFHARPRIGVIDDPAFLAVGRLKEAVVSRRIDAIRALEDRLRGLRPALWMEYVRYRRGVDWER